jgi:hypothetical protein
MTHVEIISIPHKTKIQDPIQYLICFDDRQCYGDIHLGIAVTLNLELILLAVFDRRKREDTESSLAYNRGHVSSRVEFLTTNLSSPNGNSNSNSNEYVEHYYQKCFFIFLSGTNCGSTWRNRMESTIARPRNDRYRMPKEWRRLGPLCRFLERGTTRTQSS